jgi:hypothetical protein
MPTDQGHGERGSEQKENHASDPPPPAQSCCVLPVVGRHGEPPPRCFARGHRLVTRVVSRARRQVVSGHTCFLPGCDERQLGHSLRAPDGRIATPDCLQDESSSAPRRPPSAGSSSYRRVASGDGSGDPQQVRRLIACFRRVLGTQGALQPSGEHGDCDGMEGNVFRAAWPQSPLTIPAEWRGRDVIAPFVALVQGVASQGGRGG